MSPPTPAAPVGRGVRAVVYGVAGTLTLLLIALFVRTLPDAAARARAGWQRTHEAACAALDPSPDNSVLGAMPAAAPDFTLKNFAGQSVQLSSLRGQVVLVNFWATWCKTCTIEIPSMERLVTSMRGKPFRLLAVSVDDDWPTVRRYFAKGTPLEILLDSARDTPKRYGTEKYPESFIIDKQGNIRYYIVSDRDWSKPQAAECLQSLIDE